MPDTQSNNYDKDQHDYTKSKSTWFNRTNLYTHVQRNDTDDRHASRRRDYATIKELYIHTYYGKDSIGNVHEIDHTQNVTTDTHLQIYLPPLQTHTTPTPTNDKTHRHTTTKTTYYLTRFTTNSQNENVQQPTHITSIKSLQIVNSTHSTNVLLGNGSTTYDNDKMMSSCTGSPSGVAQTGRSLRVATLPEVAADHCHYGDPGWCSHLRVRRTTILSTNTHERKKKMLEEYTQGRIR